jgi:hypothetical protein
MSWALVLVGVVLVCALVVHVVLVVHLFRLFLGLALSLLAVEPILALCFSLLLGKYGSSMMSITTTGACVRSCQPPRQRSLLGAP